MASFLPPALSGLLATALIAGVLCALGIALMRPWLQRVASARPEARSSHRQPTPQGAGLAVTAASLVAAVATLAWSGLLAPRLVVLAVAMAAAAGLGFADDLRPMAWRPKLLGQAAAAALAVAALPGEATLVPPALYWLERACAVFAVVAVVNIVNFVDGIDEITIAHGAPALAAIVLAGLLLPLAPTETTVAAAMIGALLGFWPWNRHPARIFLGDSGSLPVGLVLGWLAAFLALSGHPAAALLVLLYPLADGGLTLLRRAFAGRRLTEPHRDHAYQRAVDTGLAAPRVALTVALVSLACGVLALTTILADTMLVSAGALSIGLAWVLAPIIGWLRRTAT